MLWHAALGTLNHTMLTREALSRREIRQLGIVIGVWPHEPDAIETTNRDFLADLPEGSIGCVPRGAPHLAPADFGRPPRPGSQDCVTVWPRTEHNRPSAYWQARLGRVRSSSRSTSLTTVPHRPSAPRHALTQEPVDDAVGQRAPRGGEDHPATPMVSHEVSPSEVSMSTRVTASVPWDASRMRTLKSMSSSSRSRGRHG